jgi:predicted component of type VI protein secretion system
VSVPEDPVTAWALFNDAPPPRVPSLFQRIAQRPPSPRGSLHLTLGPRAQALRVDSDMVAQGLLVGRNERCDVVVPDKFASRVHAVLLEVDEVVHVIDTGSSNGTWTVDGERVRCRPLAEAEVLRIGEAMLEWRAVH